MDEKPIRLYIFEHELKHYGVKGMRWGHRKNRDTSKNNHSKSPGDVILKKGTNFQRIATGANMNYTKGVYLSYKAKDKELYRGVLGRMRVSWMINNEPGKVQLKQITMTANKDIRIPSKEKRIQELDNLLKTNKKEVIALINDGEAFSRRSKGYDGTKTNSVDNTMYERFNNALALGVDKHPVIGKYYSSLQKQGYDAIPDENDIRLSTFKAKAPVIFFDTMDSIGSIKVKDLSAGEVFSAYDRSIASKTVRSIILPHGVGRENTKQDSRGTMSKANRQQSQDKHSLNKKYTLDDLGKDWGINRLSSRQIKKVSDLMDDGHTHDEAAIKVMNAGNKAVDLLLSKYKL
jgi:hypothetical protein